MMTIRDDLYWLALTVWQEAQGEPFEGELAVAWVIMNRAHARARSIPDIVLEPLQFSCWNANSVTRRNIDEAEDSAAWLSCFRASAAVYFALLPDNTRGANSYLVATLTPKPSWYDAARITATIGHHVFLRLP